jgi:DNA modification methylase
MSASPIIREVTIGDCRLIQGDCLSIMPLLGKVDAVVTDPPYGINQAGGFSGAGGFSKPIARREYKGDWDDARPPSAVFKAILDASRVQIIWGGQYFADLLPAKGKWLWWDKCQTMPTFGDGEMAWTSLSGNAPKKIVYNNNGLQAKEKGRVHPTQKPIEVMQWCLGFLPDAETILDPFMGSGTTLVACAKLGRKGIGIELDPDYFDIAVERVRKAYEQADMFVPAPSKPVETQADLLEDD